MTVVNVLSIDVEEWFHLLDLPSTPPPGRWGELPATVDRNTRGLLEILAASGSRGTFFVLGWVAQRYPELVRSIHAAGHEVACHGHLHELVYRQGPERFARDLRQARESLEDVLGESVLGYRAPGFSIRPDTPWAFDLIRRAGFLYDASVFPARRGHGGFPGARLEPHRFDLPEGGQLAEFPMTVLPLGPLRLPFSGGGYLRLLPYAAIRHAARRTNAAGRPICTYLHPREIDPDHPRLEMGLRRRFKSYVNLRSTREKLRRLLEDFTFAPMADVLRQRGLLEDAEPARQAR